MLGTACTKQRKRLSGPPTLQASIEVQYSQGTDVSAPAHRRACYAHSRPEISAACHPDASTPYRSMVRAMRVCLFMCSPNSNCFGAIRKLSPRRCPRFWYVSQARHNTSQHTHTHVIMQRPLTAARTTSVSIRTVYHERPIALSNHGNQGESHNVVLRPPHEEPRAVSSRRKKQQETPQHKVEAG